MLNRSLLVITNAPTPDEVAKKMNGGVEDTLLLINLVKDIQMKKMSAVKVKYCQAWLLLFSTQISNSTLKVSIQEQKEKS